MSLRRFLTRQKKSPKTPACMSSDCPLPNTEELENVFNIFDANGDGKISVSELGNLMRSLGNDATDDELRLMMAEADLDGDGVLNFPEFMALNTEGVDSVTRVRDLANAFNMFDMDGNGFISAADLHAVLGKLGESCSLDECRGMIGRVDADGDGQVSYNEFLAMMNAPSKI